MRSPVGAPDDLDAGNVLAEKRGNVWAVVGEFGFMPGLCVQSDLASWACGEQIEMSRAA